MSGWQNAQTFVELGLSIDQYLTGYVDAYYGPAAIREAVEARGKVPLDGLSTTVELVIHSTQQDAALSEERRECLLAELKAMQTTLRILKGEKIDIYEESRGLYGLTPTWTEESTFEKVHQELESLLPGSEPLAERMENFRNKTIIPAEALQSIVRILMDDFRRRTEGMLALPEGESCELAFVQNKPWSAYNWYLGNCSSRIEVNTDLPMYASSLPHIIAHEAYPGHHTEHAIKEKKHYREGGELEHCILLSNVPSGVVSEGIAENALEMIARPEEIAQIIQSVLDQAGLTAVNGEQINQVLQARRPLGKVEINQIILLHGEGASDDEVVHYGMRYGLFNEQRGRKALEFFKDPLWRSYITLYSMGYELVNGFINRGENKVERFLKLLQEPATVSQLRR